jgi:hypothetical protein
MTQPDATWPAANIVLEDFENGDTLDPTKFAAQVLSALQYLATHHDHTGFPNGAILTWTFGRTAGVGGLTIINNATTPNSKIDVTADTLTVYDGASAITRLANVSVTIDITVTGANGRDAGSEAANTFYYIWIIRNPSNGNVRGLFSTSATAPTMPSGYTQKRRVGAVRNNDSSNFQAIVQREDYLQFMDDDIGLVVNAVNDTTSWQTVAIGAIPPIARVGSLQVIFHRTTGALSGNSLLVRVNGSAGGGYRAGTHAANAPAQSIDARTIDMVLNEDQEFQWSTSDDRGDEITIRCVGWREVIGPIV